MWTTYTGPKLWDNESSGDCRHSTTSMLISCSPITFVFYPPIYTTLDITAWNSSAWHFLTRLTYWDRLSMSHPAVTCGSQKVSPLLVHMLFNFLSPTTSWSLPHHPGRNRSALFPFYIAPLHYSVRELLTLFSKPSCEAASFSPHLDQVLWKLGYFLF